MKKLTLNKKLSLHKETIVKLNATQMSKIVGGDAVPITDSLATGLLPTKKNGDTLH